MPSTRCPLRTQVGELPRLLEELSDRETAIVRARYGLDGSEHTLSDLARRLGVSAERVRQIEQGALEKMRVLAARPDASGRSERHREPTRSSSVTTPGHATALPCGSVSPPRGSRARH
jgi:hypothetical protein